MRDDYWEQSTEPLSCFCFVAPLLLLYELGILWLGPAGMRNGADVWLRGVLADLGLVQTCVLPALTCGLLLAWHHLSRRTWQLRGEVLSGMVCESVALGLALIVIAQVLTMFVHGSASTANVVSQSDRVPHLLSYLGAGIYEELLFRLLLLSGLIHVCGRIGMCRMHGVVFAVITSSLLFAAAHYRLFFNVGLEFSWFSFAFRALAGAFFSALYLRRGFGIAVGTHAVYDILVVSSF